MLLSLSLAKNHSATNKSILFYLSSSFSRIKVNSSSRRTSAVTTTAAVSLFSSSSGGSSSSSPTPLLLRHSHLLSTATTTTSELFSLSSLLMTTATTRRSAMSSDNYQAWRVEEQEDGSFIGNEKSLSVKDTLPIPPNENQESNTVLIKVTHSSLNYKDALSSLGKKGGVTRNFPHTPGIDAAGYIVSSTDGDDNSELEGQSVLVTGYDLGMNTDGGFGGYIRVPKEWIITPNPFEFKIGNIDSDEANRTSMIYGTAGLTAALSVEKLLMAGNAKPTDGKILVTGSTGNVGSITVELLSNLGFDVIAISGKVADVEDTTTNTNNKLDFLMELGAKEVLGREVLVSNKRPLLKPLYAHAIDTVGGTPLVEILKQIKNGGSVTTCGNAAGIQMDALTVLPFILRGINLLGIDSVQISLNVKHNIWKKLASTWKCSIIEESVIDIGRNEIDSYLKLMLNGQSAGKIVLDHNLTPTTTNDNSKL